jgi:hypothetical protein
LASITPGIESNPGKENAGIKTPSPLADGFELVIKPQDGESARFGKFHRRCSPAPTR